MISKEVGREKKREKVGERNIGWEREGDKTDSEQVHVFVREN